MAKICEGFSKAGDDSSVSTNPPAPFPVREMGVQDAPLLVGLLHDTFSVGAIDEIQKGSSVGVS
jgi:hypothetical protein